MNEIIWESISFILAGILTWLAIAWWLKRETVAARSFESWATDLYSCAHELIDADMHVARCEARLMALIGTVPPETAYQTIRRIGLGRQMEAAILQKLEETGLGARLPVVDRPSVSVTPMPLAPVSRRRPGG